MSFNILKFFVGSRNQRLLKKYRAKVSTIAAFEAGLSTLPDGALAERMAAYRASVQSGVPLDTLLPEVFALVREAGKRALGMRHFDVQMIGGMVLHDGKISEMSTGEGKTLVATLPACLNALAGSVHIVTVNDYLAKRDAQWMGPLYECLGLSVGIVVPGMERSDKKAAYQCDIVYATNNELGFDYLRDKMAVQLEQCNQSVLRYAIVDEVDSILIDEARTPLIISGSAEDSSELYRSVDRVVRSLIRQSDRDAVGDYLVDEKSKQAHLSESGHDHAEALLREAGLLHEDASLYDPANIMLVHHLNAALRAHAVFRKDVDYLVTNQQVVIVDEHTGRTMTGRRWSDGLHQAIEAKEGVPIQSENQTLASITFQNFFRMYHKLAGMTGTADTEAYEFQQIYGLEVVVIPPNKKSQRVDMPDKVYMSTQEKFDAILDEIEVCLERQQPILVGTISIETSEMLSNLLNQQGIKHKVLNAKFHAQEAQIIAEAGRPGTVTIATNMAGRGTDIVLGGSLEAEIKDLESPTEAQLAVVRQDWQVRHDAVVATGGLYILGTERHESRRIDNQLRGRCGRQGDPGTTQFFLSLEDSLMRIFGSDRMVGLMRKLGVQPGEAITHRWVTSSIENAQRKVESHHFDIRKQLIEYDNVANDQRQAIYSQRDELMQADDVSDGIKTMRMSVVQRLVAEYMPPDAMEESWDVDGLDRLFKQDFLIDLPIRAWVLEAHDGHAVLAEKIVEALLEQYQAKEQQATSAIMRQFERAVMLHTIDQHWKDHLAQMDYLRQSIHLRGYAQKDPKQEFKREAFMMFAQMLQQIKLEVIQSLARADIRSYAEQFSERAMEYRQDGLAVAAHEEPEPRVVNGEAFGPSSVLNRVGRNEPCPCGSKKKYKHCHGMEA